MRSINKRLQKLQKSLIQARQYHMSLLEAYDYWQQEGDDSQVEKNINVYH